MSSSDPVISNSKIIEQTLRLRESPFHRTGEIKFTWTIKKYPIRPERKGQSFQSPCFTVDVGNTKTTWKMDLAPKGNDIRENRDWVSIFLQSQNSFPVYARFTVSLLNTSNEIETIDESITQGCIFCPLTS